MSYLENKGLTPQVEEGDFELLKQGKPDFMGLNYYQTTTFEENPLEGGAEMNSTGKKVLLRTLEFQEF
jgi:6-phospho-beta-glucosidase